MRQLALRFLGPAVLPIVAISLGCSSGGEHVTGQKPSDPTTPYNQAETAIGVQKDREGNTVITIAYNDDTDDDGKTIIYTDTTRTVLRGASNMGWSFSTDLGKTWTHGKLRTPSGWSVLWGDPSIGSATVGEIGDVVALTNLAGPDDKFPASGSVVGPLAGALAGACIALSFDGGKNFAMKECVRDGDHFYDGSSTVVSSEGLICVAFNDVNDHEIDVWCADGLANKFKLLPNPFGGDLRAGRLPLTIDNHPRLRLSAGGRLGVVALDSDNRALWLNVWDGTSWLPAPVQLSNPGVVGNPDVPVGTRKMRTGPQFTWDIGDSSINEDDAIRAVYTVAGDDGRFHLKATKCDISLLHCREAPEWSTLPTRIAAPGSQFNPNLKASPIAGTGGASLNAPSTWKLSYLSTDDDLSNLSVRQGNLAVLAEAQLDATGKRPGLFIPSTLVAPHEVCPDLGRGYWGDYDDLQVVDFVNDSPRYVRAFTNSGDGPAPPPGVDRCVQQVFISKPVHVGAILFQ